VEPVDHATLLVVVRADDATTADVASTALLVLGGEQGRAFLADPAALSRVREAWAVEVDPSDPDARVDRRLRPGS
jgi:thiamine biosynthesis lipoprotein ApbE